MIPIGYYELPAFVDNHTLLILSSWSGTTEEILSTVEEAKKRKAKILVLAQGGKLAQMAKQNKLPGYYNFLPRHNPCNQPRMSLGYQVLSIIIMLTKADLLSVSDKQITQLIAFLKGKQGAAQKKAKALAQAFKEKIPSLVGADFLMGSLHAWRNQLNENAKQLAVYFEIPELNHHLLEGLAYPKKNPSNLIFLFVKSKFYLPRVNQRFAITQKILKQYKIAYEEVKLEGKNKLEQVFEIIQLGSFASFYLAILNNLDPSPIPWVDYFKKELEI